MQTKDLAGPPSEPSRTLSQQTFAQTTFLGLTLSAANCCAPLGKAPNLPEPQCPPATNGRARWGESHLNCKIKAASFLAEEPGVFVNEHLLVKGVPGKLRPRLCRVSGY